MIQGLWDWQVEATIDIKIGDADADSYNYGPTAVILAWWETSKKDKHGKQCNYRWKKIHRLLFK